MKKIIMDLDNTICTTISGDYINSKPVDSIISRMHEFKSLGYEIIILTSRNMKTYNGNIGKVNIHTLPIIIDWLKKFNIPYDEIHVGKPWCGTDGFYVDDRCLRPDEFATLPIEQITQMFKSN